VQTPEQALKWLDPTYNGTVPISDEHIIALAVNKQTDRKDQAELCRVAVKIIAEYRNSDMLRSWLAGTHHTDEGEKIATACAYLGIDDRYKIDGDVLESVRMIRMEDGKDDPSKQIEIQQHYEVLRDYLAGQYQSLPQPDYDNPVGLSNMGNTCYLNCLLQYFYTIKPLREVILDFNDYKIDTTAPNFYPKKVDAQIISKAHVIKTQQCKSRLM
jgi:ubiquitin carboxyl-terminal hydrolase 25